MLDTIIGLIPKYVETKENVLYLSISHYGKLPIWSVNYKDAAKNKLFEEAVTLMIQSDTFKKTGAEIIEGIGFIRSLFISHPTPSRESK